MVLAFDFIIWWYTKGLKKTTFFLGGVFTSVYNTFSIKPIVTTFFAPWRKLVGVRRPGLDGLVDWMLDNIVSRFVGVLMRSFLLITFLIFFALYLVFACLVYLFWIFNIALIIFIFVYGTKISV